MNYKSDFPIFKNYSDLVYLDSSATSQKPQVVIDAVSTFYAKNNANIHRGMYDLSQAATDMYENTRKKVADFIGAKDASEVIFTSGATEALNLVAFGWAKKHLQKGDIIVISEMEHHANILPWQQLRKEMGIELAYLPITKDFRLDFKKSVDLKSDRIKLLSLSHASNVLGTINPLEEIIPFFKKINAEIKICIDAAQSIPHMPIDVVSLQCDFFTFSSHKMLGPSGVGVLYTKKEVLQEMEPFIFGGGMVRKVTKEDALWAPVPDKFEGGTPAIEGVIGLGVAIEYLQEVGFGKVQKHEKELITYTLKKFAQQQKVTLFGPKNNEERLGIFSFAIDKVHPHDTAEILNRFHIAVRTGHHCAQPLMDVLGIPGTARASIYLYNTKEDIDRLFNGIEEVKKVFNR
ncbi:MAG TPA: SufS family cysteine desulfurase [Candidatus Sulfotelmatobacter sp.]|jgi:cysteine desulfurase/selenocysteine lyase|nr:SufS family cysteine desulfurase [Candidatus Sulfotelmatobacter sp.]